MPPIEHHPVNREALRDDQIAVHGEQAPAMMRVDIAAPLIRHSNAAAHGRTSCNGARDSIDTRPTKLENRTD